MKIGPAHVDLAMRLRKQIQKETATIGDGEGVAVVLLWSFVADHAKAHKHELEPLFRDQVEAFLGFARDNLEMVRPQ